jgi:hypothetical protein
MFLQKQRTAVAKLFYWASILVTVGGVGTAYPAETQEEGQSDKVKVTVVVILASENQDNVDPRLKFIAQEVQKKDPHLTCFKLKSMTCRSLAVDEKSAFNLVDDQTAYVIVKRPADEKNRVELAVKTPDKVGFVYQTVCGKFLPLMTTYRTQSNERLILAVRVQPCAGAAQKE